MQHAIIKTEKNKKRSLFVVGVPICIGAVLLTWIAEFRGHGDFAPMWAKIAGSAVLIAVAVGIVRAFLRFDGLLSRMKMSVNCATDDEMSALLGRCREIGDGIYLSDQYVLNFDSMVAYSRAQILKIEPLDRKNGNPAIRVTYGPDVWDNLYYSDPVSRDRAMEMLIHEMKQ